MDPRDRADEALARARARGAFVVTPDNAISPMDATSTVQIPRILVATSDTDVDPDSTVILSSNAAQGLPAAPTWQPGAQQQAGPVPTAGPPQPRTGHQQNAYPGQQQNHYPGQQPGQHPGPPPGQQQSNYPGQRPGQQQSHYPNQQQNHYPQQQPGPQQNQYPDQQPGQQQPHQQPAPWPDQQQNRYPNQQPGPWPYPPANQPDSRQR